MKLSAPCEKEIRKRLSAESWELVSERKSPIGTFQEWRKDDATLQFNGDNMHRRTRLRVAKEAGWITPVHRDAEEARRESRSATQKQMRGLRLALSAAKGEADAQREKVAVLERQVADMRASQETHARMVAQDRQRDREGAQAELRQSHEESERLARENDDLRGALMRSLTLIEQTNRRVWREQTPCAS